MTAQQRITILGCGSSGGVPRIGAGWGECDPANPRNRRRRCSILIERSAATGEKTTVLVDTSPDVREQLLDANVTALDAVLFTHDHADHTHGIDDLRALFIHNRKRLDLWMDERTERILCERFGYIFRSPVNSDYPPIAELHRILPQQQISITGAGGSISAMPFDVEHGSISALGFRFGNLAYTPDVNRIPDAALPYLENLDVWIIDALRPKPHPSHFSLDDALEWIIKMQPRQAILTNLHVDMDYATLVNTLPPGVIPAHDGLQIEVALP